MLPATQVASRSRITVTAVEALLGQHWVLLLAVAGQVGFHCLTFKFASLHPDFIDHWVWSTRLRWTYFEHPGMVAWIIRAWTTVFGASETTLATLAAVSSVGTLVLVYALAFQLFGRLAAACTVLTLQSTVYFTAGALAFLVDQPLELAWLGALWALLAYQRTARPQWLLLVGAMAGLGALSKYTMVLFYLAALVYALVVPARRRELLNPWQYVGAILALTIFSPVLVSNAFSGWESFRFQAAKAVGGGGIGLWHVAEFLAGVLLTYSVVLLPIGGYWVGTRMRRAGWIESPQTLLAVFSIVPFAFFLVSMLDASYADPTWANTSDLAFAILLGGEMSRRWMLGKQRAVITLLGSAMVLNLTILGAIGLHFRYPLAIRDRGRDPVGQVVGWREEGRAVDNLLAEQNLGQPRYVISLDYPLASQFALHLPWHPLPFSLRRPQRNVWLDRDQMTPLNTIVVCPDKLCRWTTYWVEKQFGWQVRLVGVADSGESGTREHRVAVLVPLVPGAQSGRIQGGEMAQRSRVP